MLSSLEERQRHDELVDNLGRWTRGLDFPRRHGKIDLEACSNHRFFPRRGPTERTRYLSTNSLGYTPFEITPVQISFVSTDGR